MTERLNHKLNVDAIKTVKDVKNVFYTMELVASVDADNPIYEVAKEYFTIPYVAPELKFSTPRKSIEEIQQEFDEKIDTLIEKVKEYSKFEKEVAEKGYDYKFDGIIKNFEYAKEHGHFPYLNLAYTTTGLSAYNSPYTETSFVIKQGNNHKGYYTIGNQRYLRYYMKEKPNIVVRFFMKTCLGFCWVDE